MGLKTWLLDLFSPKSPTRLEIACNHERKAADLYYRMLAFETCVRLIGNLISKCEFRTFREGVEVFGEDYYKFNIKPNANQNSSRFYQDLVYQLYINNEALVIQPKGSGGIFVADSFDKTKMAMKDWMFKNIEIDDYKLRDTFLMSEVLYFQLSNKDINNLLDQMYSSYSELLGSAMNSYRRNRGRKGILNVDGQIPGNEEKQKKTLEMLMRRFKTLYEAENGIVLLEKQYTYDDISAEVKNLESSRDIREMINDVYDMTAAAFSISGALIRGDVAGLDDAVNFTLTFCIEPLANLIEKEINGKLYRKNQFQAGTRCKVDTSKIKHIGMSELSQSVYNLINTGLYSVNEFRRKVGEPKINEAWADKHFMLLASAEADKAVTNNAEQSNDEE